MSDHGDFLGIVGTFPSADSLYEAARQAQGAGLRRLDAILPVGDRASVYTVLPEASSVRWVALVGGLTGIAAALVMTIWMSWNYPLVVGGKPITSYPPFLVAGFEWMVLFGAVSAIGGWLYLAGLPDLVPSDCYHPDLAVDQFALVVQCDESSPERSLADGVLRDAGAIDVREVRHRGYTALERVA